MLKACLLVALLVTSAFSSHAGQPTITVDYSPNLDAACSLVRGCTIKDEWKDELVSRKAEFEALWAVVGPGLIEATETITGQSFPNEHVTVRMTLCNLPAQKAWAIVNVTDAEYLKYVADLAR